MNLRPSALIQRLNDAVAQGDDEPGDNQERPEPIRPPAPPAKPVRGGAGMVDWWNALNPGGKEPEQSKKPDAEPCAHPNPHAVHSRPNGRLVAYWCADCETQLPVPDEYNELDDAEDDEEDGDKVPTKIRRQWSVRGNGNKVYSRPKYRSSGKKDEKKSLLDAWRGMPPVTRHALYNATALCIGFSLGVPQFFTHETAYLVHTYGSWTSFYVCIWYGVAVGIWVIDHRTRDLLPPFALLGRMPLVSMIVGVLLYGNPV